MASLQSSIEFKPANVRAEHSGTTSIDFEVKPSQPPAIDARADLYPSVASSIHFEVRQSVQPTAQDLHAEDTVSNGTSIDFEVAHSIPPSMHVRGDTEDAKDAATSLPATAAARATSADPSEKMGIGVQQPTSSRVPPPRESMDFQIEEDTTAGAAVVVEHTPLNTNTAGAAQGSGETYPVPSGPPPRRLSRRAEKAATSSHTEPRPITPRMRSPASSYRPHPGDTYPLEGSHVGEHMAPAAAANATLPPTTSAKPVAAGGEYSDADDEDLADVDPATAAAAAPPLPGPSTATMTVSNHHRSFSGTAWSNVIEYSRDTVERTIVNETAAALNIDAQFLRVSKLTANSCGMAADISIVHDPETLSEADINAKIVACPYENTRMLHDMRTVRGEHQVYGLAAALQGAGAAGNTHDSSDSSSDDDDDRHDAGAQEDEDFGPPPAHSFTTMVGSGMLLIDYATPTAAAAGAAPTHLELFFVGTPAEMRARWIRECVSDYVRVPVEELTVSYAGDPVADRMTGAELEWINGSVIDIVHVPAQRGAAAKVRAVPVPLNANKKSNAVRKASRNATANSKSTPQMVKKASVAKKTKKSIKEGGHADAAAATPAKKKSTRKTAKEATLGSTANSIKKKKTTKDGKDSAKENASTPAMKGTKPKNKKKGKKASSSQSRDGASSRGRRTAATTPRSVRKPPHYLAPTQSMGQQPQLTVEREIPDTLTAPRCHTPRTPRPSYYSGGSGATTMGATASLALDGTPRRPVTASGVGAHSRTSSQSGVTPVDRRHTSRRAAGGEHRGDEGQRGRSTSSAMNTPRRRTGSVGSSSAATTARSPEAGQQAYGNATTVPSLMLLPPQRATRSVQPTTPRSATRHVLSVNRSGGAAGAPSQAETPSVSRRSHSPHRTPPLTAASAHAVPVPVGRYGGFPSVNVNTAAQSQVYMDLGPSTPTANPPTSTEGVHYYHEGSAAAVDGYDMSYEVEYTGEPTEVNVFM